MNDFCAFIVIFCLIIGLPISIVWTIINLIRKNKLKSSLILLCSSIFGVIIFTIMGSINAYNSGEITTKQNTDIESTKSETLETIDDMSKNEEIVSEPAIEESSTENLLTESENHETISIENEEQFKRSCVEVVYNDIDKEWIGKYITKEILFTSTEQIEYQCASTESYVEEYSDYQHVYAVYDIFDCRFDKSFPIYSNDVIRIYGIVTGVEYNWANGLNYPVIDMYYADYIREWRKPQDVSKSIDDLIQERKIEKEKTESENKYFDSLNSDYAGQTKNIANMELLSKEEFESQCDSMNFNDMTSTIEDLSGRYVKIHLQLDRHKVFTSEGAKRNHLGDLVDTYDINDNVWYCNLFCERTDEYIKSQILSYFANNAGFDIDNLKKEQELTVYGMILNYEVNDGFHNEFDFLVVYME